MTTTVSLKQRETRTSSGPIPHPLKLLTQLKLRQNPPNTHNSKINTRPTLPLPTPSPPSLLHPWWPYAKLNPFIRMDHSGNTNAYALVVTLHRKVAHSAPSPPKLQAYLKNHWTNHTRLFVYSVMHFSCWTQIWQWKFEFQNF